MHQASRGIFWVVQALLRRKHTMRTLLLLRHVRAVLVLRKLSRSTQRGPRQSRVQAGVSHGQDTSMSTDNCVFCNAQSANLKHDCSTVHDAACEHETRMHYCVKFLEGGPTLAASARGPMIRRKNLTTLCCATKMGVAFVTCVKRGQRHRIPVHKLRSILMRAFPCAHFQSA